MYVPNRALGDTPALEGKSEDEAFTALTSLLEPRIEQAQGGQLSGKSLGEIRREERKRAGVQPDPGRATTLHLRRKKTFGVYAVHARNPGARTSGQVLGSARAVLRRHREQTSATRIIIDRPAFRFLACRPHGTRSSGYSDRCRMR